MRNVKTSKNATFIKSIPLECSGYDSTLNWEGKVPYSICCPMDGVYCNGCPPSGNGDCEMPEQIDLYHRKCCQKYVGKRAIIEDGEVEVTIKEIYTIDPAPYVMGSTPQDSLLIAERDDGKIEVISCQHGEMLFKENGKVIICGDVFQDL